MFLKYFLITAAIVVWMGSADLLIGLTWASPVSWVEYFNPQDHFRLFLVHHRYLSLAGLLMNIAFVAYVVTWAESGK